MKRRTWFRLFLILILFVGMFYPLPFLEGADRLFWGKVADAAHFPLFFILVCLILSEGWLTPGPAALFCFLLAAAVEVIQPLFNRSESATDLLNGTLGILSGVLCVIGQSKRSSALWLGATYMLSIFSLLLVCYPAYNLGLGVYWRNTHFPLLASFQDRSELSLWTKNNIHTSLAFVKAEDGPMLTFSPSLGTSEASISYNAGDLDWSRASSLEFEARAQEMGQKLHLRIDDAHDCTETKDRFNTTITLENAWNTVILPIQKIREHGGNRPLDMLRIRRVIFFLRNETSKEVHIRRIQLR